MLPDSIQKRLTEIRKSMLVVDTETCAFYPDGTEVNIRTAFEDYIQYGKVKWFGAYSYKTGKEYYLNAQTETMEVINLLKSHNVIVGFNNEDFDFPLLVNNGLTCEHVRYLQVDCMQILGTVTGRNSKGFAFKNRGLLMDYKFKSNSLKSIAETMNLTTQKGDIDYKIFQKDAWTPEEVSDIKKYLSSDVMATKEMLDKLWLYWHPFAELIDEKYVYDLSWMRSSIASLSYKAACRVMQVEPTYSEESKGHSEEMGGRVIEPTTEEAVGVWQVDVGSLYPHIISMFNLPAELNEEQIKENSLNPLACLFVFKGNDLFKVKGQYDISNHHLLSKYIDSKLIERIYLKETDKNNPMIYTLKILLNGLYGIFRSSTFEKIYTPNIGWDTCYIGQQVHELMEEMLKQFGFDTIAGDTDSAFLKAQKEEYNNKEYLQDCLIQIVDVINDNVPFPSSTFKINIEHYLEYVKFPFSFQAETDEETGKNKKVGNRLVKSRKGKKKNYLYIYKDDSGEKHLKLVGLPIIKDNATALAIKIYKDELKNNIITLNRASFSKETIDNIIKEYLQNPKIMELISQEYKVQAFDTYKKDSQIQAQISKGYLDGLAGIVRLIKNNKIGNAGKGQKYCTIQEALENKLSIDDLDLDKVYNELEPFMAFEPIETREVTTIDDIKKKPKSKRKPKTTIDTSS